MKETGIKVWVLTGDKIETAINIGFSAGLLSNSMDLHVVNSLELDKIKADLKEIKDKIRLSSNETTKQVRK